MNQLAITAASKSSIKVIDKYYDKRGGEFIFREYEKDIDESESMLSTMSRYRGNIADPYRDESNLGALIVNYNNEVNFKSNNLYGLCDYIVDFSIEMIRWLTLGNYDMLLTQKRDVEIIKVDSDCVTKSKMDILSFMKHFNLVDDSGKFIDEFFKSIIEDNKSLGTLYDMLKEAEKKVTHKDIEAILMDMNTTEEEKNIRMEELWKEHSEINTRVHEKTNEYNKKIENVNEMFIKLFNVSSMSELYHISLTFDITKQVEPENVNNKTTALETTIFVLHDQLAYRLREMESAIG